MGVFALKTWEIPAMPLKPITSKYMDMTRNSSETTLESVFPIYQPLSLSVSLMMWVCMRAVFEDILTPPAWTLKKTQINKKKKPKNTTLCTWKILTFIEKKIICDTGGFVRPKLCLVWIGNNISKNNQGKHFGCGAVQHSWLQLQHQSLPRTPTEPGSGDGKRAKPQGPRPGWQIHSSFSITLF